MSFKNNRIELEEKGYSVLTPIYNNSEIADILNVIQNAEQDNKSFLKTNDLFAIRQLFNVIPQVKNLLFNKNLIELVEESLGSNSFLTKAIYFDKPKQSNWFVAYHQDLSISVNQRTDVDNYTNWTYKNGQYGVQPPLEILNNIVTVRVHLDDTDKHNGALKVISESNKNGVLRKENIDWSNKKEIICEVKKGGVMLMKPLTFHASNRTTNHKQRRVIHMEFSNKELIKPLEWLERIELN
ncbi:phytanoyl-CoA dioxygenase family protein [Aquimarina sp. MMG016]|uniref:phytanoyl-CoA dioxygenase family protein n=1 Tax=Aquimarina sp. MMG016 TaxID=2822690 RepID=UPI001B3A588E|nr:phytanoyl-CoA dioxygenase family protein [Aquimarina sp. MMG016]MBQ4820142.1 phytanoyl-CoA dioxygenase family protein [Aquimarina sp. MMG016]